MSGTDTAVTTATHAVVTEVDRFAPQRNKFSLAGIDHIGIPARDPDLAGAFVERILGGIECFRAGYTEIERAEERLRHIFYHVGDQLLEVVENRDPASYPKLDSDDTNPHYAFGTTLEGLLAFVKHLEEEGIPYNGPRSHRDESVVSVYFRDLDGNNLEVATWEAVPVELTTPMGQPGGRVAWSKLAHAWRP